MFWMFWILSSCYVSKQTGADWTFWHNKFGLIEIQSEDSRMIWRRAGRGRVGGGCGGGGFIGTFVEAGRRPALIVSSRDRFWRQPTRCSVYKMSSNVVCSFIEMQRGWGVSLRGSSAGTFSGWPHVNCGLGREEESWRTKWTFQIGNLSNDRSSGTQRTDILWKSHPALEFLFAF